MPPQRRTLQTYKPVQLGRICEILDRASGGRQIDRENMEQSLLEIIHAIGLASDGAEASRLWQELSSEDPSNKTERDGYLQLARAEDPFELAQRDRRYSGLLSRSAALRRVAQRRSKTSNSPAPIWQAYWGNLSPEEQSQVRKSFKASARYHASLIRRGRVQKTKLDTALLSLADLYLSWTGQSIARHHLPYAVESRFIQFAVAALEPVGQYFEVSHSALSGRWERIVLPERKEERELGKPLLEQEPEQKS